jgi:hypothetical protein
MAWETRGGSRYYYRKRKVNGRVRSEYVGAGLGAELAADLDQERHDQAERDRAQLQLQRAADAAMDRQVDEALDLAAALAGAGLVAVGCHTHKGGWRHGRVSRKGRRR